jgi:hypothetical protein
VKRAFLLLVLTAGAYFGYTWLFGSAPARAYERFADAWARGRTEDAMKLADGEPARRAIERRRIGAVLRSPWAIDAFHGARCSVVSTSRLPSGEVALEAEQKVAFDPPGATTAIGGAVIASFHHSATLRKTGEGWKVVAFDPTFIDLIETHHHSR